MIEKNLKGIDTSIFQCVNTNILWTNAQCKYIIMTAGLFVQRRVANLALVTQKNTIRNYGVWGVTSFNASWRTVGGGPGDQLPCIVQRKIDE